MDQETFKVMWELSAPDGGAEGCFLRIPQTEYYCKGCAKPDHLEFMPDVSSPCFQIYDRDMIGFSSNIYPKVLHFPTEYSLVSRSKR